MVHSVFALNCISVAVRSVIFVTMLLNPPTYACEGMSLP